MNLLKDDQLQFFPGIFQKSDIKEDEVVFSDEYSLKLGSVRANAKGGSLLGQKLLKHYDWTKLENLILKHLGKYLWVLKFTMGQVAVVLFCGEWGAPRRLMRNDTQYVITYSHQIVRTTINWN